MPQERAEAFDFWGLKTLVGPELAPGDSAPPFTLVNGNHEMIGSEAFAGRPLLISVVPSLETGVCSVQTRRFDAEVASYGGALQVLAVSADLPFTQARWASAEALQNVTVLSDHRDMSFGQAFGTLVKELRIESRAVFVVDAEGVVRYAEYVPSAGSEPNYAAALAAVREVVS